ncbi:hypothetical protein [Ruania alba]|uniref:hypothetical protein n=1 Tax=Ruania alba TaxID=648782 RepID=UPI000B7ED8FA|nr:hypothetical protein [Ruania alba]
MRHRGDSSEGYYYNLRTGEIEHGYVSDWHDRIGPYATATEAASALERAHARNEAWEAEDRQWYDDPDEHE